jgi:hypothetical protein
LAASRRMAASPCVADPSRRARGARSSPSPALAGEGWGGGARRECGVRGESPHPPRSIERVGLPRKRERRRLLAAASAPLRIESSDSNFKQLNRHCERKRSNPSRGVKKEWIASSQVLLAMTSNPDTTPHSRGARRPRFASTSPSLNRGRRESRMPIAPAVVRTTSARVDHRLNRITPAFPARMGYGLLRALLGDRAFLPPSPGGLTMHHNPVGPDTSPPDLTPASGRQDHTTSPYAPVWPKVLPNLVRSGEFWRRQLAASFVRAPRIAHEVHLALRSYCAPDAVASIASRPA